MDSNFMPIIRLEVEGMKSQIMAALGTRGSELGELIEAEIDQAINSFDFAGQVKVAVHNGLHTAIHNYFERGDGYRMLQDAAKSLIEKQNDPEEDHY